MENFLWNAVQSALQAHCTRTMQTNQTLVFIHALQLVVSKIRQVALLRSLTLRHLTFIYISALSLFQLLIVGWSWSQRGAINTIKAISWQFTIPLFVKLINEIFIFAHSHLNLRLWAYDYGYVCDGTRNVSINGFLVWIWSDQQLKEFHFGCSPFFHWILNLVFNRP